MRHAIQPEEGTYFHVPSIGKFKCHACNKMVERCDECGLPVESAQELHCLGEVGHYCDC